MSKSMRPALVLKPGKEKSLLRGHPWVFSGAVANVVGNPESGQTLAILAADQRFLAWAVYSPKSQIRARVWSFVEDDVIDAAWFGEKIHSALARREHVATRSNAIRLLHGEADGLPGFVCDRFDDVLVVQLLSAGVEFHRDTLIKELVEHTGFNKVYERSDVDSRKLEGLAERVGPMSPSDAEAAGSDWYAQPLEVFENEIRYEIDIVGGHKTGFYVDQRDNRRLVQRLARGRVLNCFSYTGGFSLAALKGGASDVWSLDSSGPAIELAKRNMHLNQFEPNDANISHGPGLPNAYLLEADVFKELRRLCAEGQQFDVIVLDPPKFAPNAASVERAARAYKDINLLACQLLAPGGDLLTFSCSGAITSDLFRKIVAGAAADAKVPMLVKKTLTAGDDHPVLLSFPEGEYLKGLHLQRQA